MCVCVHMSVFGENFVRKSILMTRGGVPCRPHGTHCAEEARPQVGRSPPRRCGGAVRSRRNHGGVKLHRWKSTGRRSKKKFSQSQNMLVCNNSRAAEAGFHLRLVQQSCLHTVPLLPAGRSAGSGVRVWRIYSGHLQPAHISCTKTSRS